MYINLYGPDFVRTQRSGTSPIADPLHPDVLFSGAYEDGQVLYFTQTIDATGTTTGGNILFGQTFSTPPLVIGGFRISDTLVQDGITRFNAGEVIAPSFYYYYKNGVGRTVDWGFSFQVMASKLVVSVTKLKGTAMFLVVDP